MGGSAFAAGPCPLHTPRMPPAVYEAVRARCAAALRQLFVCVATPIEAPAKKDFGDVDFLVALERRVVFPTAAEAAAHPAYGRDEGDGGDGGGEKGEDGKDEMIKAVRRVLGAERVVVPRGQAAANFAVPWPADLLHLVPGAAPNATDQEEKDAASTAAAEKEKGNTLPDGTRRPYIQVDVHVCPSADHLQWMLFKHAHGDFWGLMGSALRPLGLTVDDTALWLRVPEIERYNGPRSRVLLTSEPAEVLAFLGLSPLDTTVADDEGGGGGGGGGAKKRKRMVWEEPFRSADELFRYAASSRLFFVFPESSPPPPNGVDGSDDTSTLSPLSTASASTATTDRAKLRSRERRRLKSRPLFRIWLDDFIPACRAAGTHLPPPEFARLTPAEQRARVRAEAAARWPDAGARYAAVLQAWLREREREEVWNGAIKPCVPADLEPSYRGALCGALRRIILGEEGGGEGEGSLLRAAGVPADSVRALRDPETGAFCLDAVRGFVAEHWEAVGRAGWGRLQERYRESKKEKLVALAAEAKEEAHAKMKMLMAGDEGEVKE